MTELERLIIDQTEEKIDLPPPRKQRVGGSRKRHVIGKQKRFYEMPKGVPPLCSGYMTLPEAERTYVRGRVWAI